MADPALVLGGRYYRTFPMGSPLGYTEEELCLDPTRTVFLIVDVYGRGFDGDLDSVDVPELYRKCTQDYANVVVDHIAPAKRAAKQAGLRIVYLENYLSPGLTQESEWRNLSLRVHGIDVLGAWREPNNILSYSEIITPEPGDVVIRKQLASGFFETHLDSLLRSWQTYNLVTVGFDSRVCLAMTVMDAMYRNYRVIVLRDAIGTIEEPETADQGVATFLAVRWLETQVGYTSTTQQWAEACAGLSESRGVE
jgi:nicotinamidase-related amidase